MDKETRIQIMTGSAEFKVTKVAVVKGGALVQFNDGQETFLSASELLDQVKNGSAQVMPEDWGGE